MNLRPQTSQINQQEWNEYLTEDKCALYKFKLITFQTSKKIHQQFYSSSFKDQHERLAKTSAIFGHSLFINHPAIFTYNESFFVFWYSALFRTDTALLVLFVRVRKGHQLPCQTLIRIDGILHHGFRGHLLRNISAEQCV